MKQLLTFWLLTFFSFAAFSQTTNSTLDGSASYDVDGTISAWQWKQIAGPGNSVITTPNAVKTTVTNLVAGIYRYELTVTDNQGAIGKDTVSITVKAANIAPKADAGPDQIIQVPGTALVMPILSATRLKDVAKNDRELYKDAELLSGSKFNGALQKQEELFNEIITFYRE